ncbi:MAG: hypothetical protein M1546_11580 [Chloroflexi bacterium]|nr:hypothetical protein [Chloroflexota bacterium]
MENWHASPDDTRLLQTMTERLISASTVRPGQVISRGPNTTGRSLLTPGCNTNDIAVYPAYWVRDPAWVAESGLIPAEDVWGWLTLMTETMQGHTSRNLASGGVIPPYAIADHINVDGSPVFYPGTYASDDTQGPPYGKYPPHDDQYWITYTAYAYAKITGDDRTFTREVPTPAGALPLWQVCELTHNAFPVDVRSQLCVASDALDEHIVDWGYNDTIIKTGKLLFPSLLRIESAMKLAHLFERAGMREEAETYRQQTAHLRRAILETFYQEDERHEAWLMSASGLGHKPDVWGSAYALTLGIVPQDLAQAIAKSLLHGYRERTTVLAGQVRHIPTTHGYWEQAQCAQGAYQNGAYWGYPAGWYIYALSLVDQSAAAAMFTEYLAYLRDNWDDSLRTCAWECINPDLQHYQNPGYLTTVALPYAVLKNKGLLA